MENCGFGWQNYILSATLSGNGISSLPVSNLQNPYGAASLGWRIVPYGDGWGGSFKAVLTSARMIRVISLHRTNLSSAALWRILIYNGATLVLDELMPCAAQNGQCLLVLPAPVSGDVIEVGVWDAGNPDGFLSVPLAYIGPLWQPQRNYASSSTESLTVGQQSTTTLSGTEFVDARYVQRGQSITHESYGDADVVVLRQIQRSAASGQNILFLPDPSKSPADLAASALFGRLTGGDLSNPYGPTDRHAQTFTLTERL